MKSFNSIRSYVDSRDIVERLERKVDDQPQLPSSKLIGLQVHGAADAAQIRTCVKEISRGLSTGTRDGLESAVQRLLSHPNFKEVTLERRIGSLPTQQKTVWERFCYMVGLKKLNTFLGRVDNNEVVILNVEEGKGRQGNIFIGVENKKITGESSFSLWKAMPGLSRLNLEAKLTSLELKELLDFQRLRGGSSIRASFVIPDIQSLAEDGPLTSPTDTDLTFFVNSWDSKEAGVFRKDTQAGFNATTFAHFSHPFIQTTSAGVANHGPLISRGDLRLSTEASITRRHIIEPKDIISDKASICSEITSENGLGPMVKNSTASLGIELGLVREKTTTELWGHVSPLAKIEATGHTHMPLSEVSLIHDKLRGMEDLAPTLHLSCGVGAFLSKVTDNEKLLDGFRLGGRSFPGFEERGIGPIWRGTADAPLSAYVTSRQSVTMPIFKMLKRAIGSQSSKFAQKVAQGCEALDSKVNITPFVSEGVCANPYGKGLKGHLRLSTGVMLSTKGGLGASFSVSKTPCPDDHSSTLNFGFGLCF